MSLSVEELRRKRLPPDTHAPGEFARSAAESTVYENLLSLSCALEDGRLKGVDGALRGSVVRLLAAMGRLDDPRSRIERERAERYAAALSDTALRRQFTDACRGLSANAAAGQKRAAEARELLQYVGAGLGLDAPELGITEAQRQNVRRVSAKTGRAWRNYDEREVRLDAARLMVAEQSKREGPAADVEGRARLLAESSVFRGMCDALPVGELQKAVNAKDALGLIKGFAEELERQKEKPAEAAQRTREIQDLRL